MTMKLDVDALHVLDDGTMAATHSTNKTIMLIKPGLERKPTEQKDEKDRPIFTNAPVIQFAEPDGEERLYWLHRFGVITDLELETEMSKQPGEKRRKLIERLQQEVDNVPG